MSKAIFLLLWMLWGCTIAVAATTEDKGKELYHSYGCALCHGWEGRGDGINAQKFEPLPTNFHDLKSYLHGNDRDSIKRSIQYGIKEDSSIMPAFEDIPPEELDQIISYLQSLQRNEGKNEN